MSERYISAVEADLALARGRVLHARFLDATSRRLEAGADVADELVLFERAVELYRNVGDVRGEAEAQFWIGTFTRSYGTTMHPRFLRSSEPAHSRPGQEIG